MEITLRPHQLDAIKDVDSLLTKLDFVLCVQPTGSGKTIIKAHYAQQEYKKGNTCLIFAHRDVLLEQISGSLCKMGVPHGFICALKTRRNITNLNVDTFGDSFYDDKSPILVVSSQTFASHLKRGLKEADFLNSVTTWLMDEAHHLITGSTWGRCVDSLPNAKGVGFTATPLRGDRKGLGRHADGYFQALSVTTNMFNLIQDGRLTLYKIYATGQIDIKGIKRDKNNELNQRQLRIRTKEADITGDAVEQYLKLLNGQPVITFCINIEHSIEVAEDFNNRGVVSVAVSSKSDPKDRANAVADLRSGRIQNLVNCDLFGEGFDAPVVAGVIMLRRTTSYSKFKQQFGRMLRISDGKIYGILLDHVGNTQYMMNTYHLRQPHDDPEWTLDSLVTRNNNEDEDEDESYETMSCSECGLFAMVEDFIDNICPDCGHEETEDEKVKRIKDIKVQEGQLVELELNTINELILKREAFYKSVTDFANGLSDRFPAKRMAVNNHAARQHSLNILRHWIQEWSMTKWKSTNKPVRLIVIDFELEFKVNIIVAQTLSESQMSKLSSKIQQSMISTV
ncbi:MAG: DEAD/DEAH box helicase family protein [Colwellia sp.]|nr:DEAD/DEAH box helicase family protein [Colwellia sp.]